MFSTYYTIKTETACISTQHKISAVLSYVTVRGERNMERAMEEQDALFAITSSP
jgi:hypothetical protein